MSELLSLSVFLMIILFIQVGFYLTIRRFADKWSGQKVANGVLLSMPAIVSFSAILIVNSFSSTIQPPQAIERVERIDSLDEAGKRISDLEAHTAYLENYLVYERRRQLILVAGLAGIFVVSLTAIGFGIYKPAEDEQ